MFNLFIKIIKSLRREFVKCVVKQLLISFSISIIATFTILLTFNFYFVNKIYPNTYVAGVKVSGMTTNQAEKAISDNISVPETITLTNNNDRYEILLQNIDFKYDIAESIEDAFNLNRKESFITTSGIQSLFIKNNTPLLFSVDTIKFDEYTNVVANQAASEPDYPGVTLDDGNILVNKGSPGTIADVDKLSLILKNKFAVADFSDTRIPTTKVDPSISDKQSENLSERAHRLIDKSISVNYEYTSHTFSNFEIIPLLSTDNHYNTENISKLINDLNGTVNRKPQSAIFKYDNGRVVEFVPAKKGVEINANKLAILIEEALGSLETTSDNNVVIEIPVSTVDPLISTEEVNELGINELIGRGTSKFKGSISSRIYNIGLASSKFNGVLVSPGETFSFNQVLGDVSAFTGYKQAYVIKDGRTVLGDGGGVCQVSTTLFRATLDAGLPIVERRSHSYRVAYYEQGSPPGLDATIYSPTTDLKFTNDTPGHLLIQTLFEPETVSLIFEIYGTNDGRIATTTKPIITSVSPPPEDLYVDDPTLPLGETKQIDYKAWGAKVNFDYTVEKDGKTIYEKTFYSNFRPWQAVFLRGTGPTIN